MKQTPKFCRDARAIASAWGAEVYVARGLRAQQLAPVLAAMARADFPRKTTKPARGWKYDEIAAWGKINVAAEGRMIIISEPVAPGVADGDGKPPPDKLEADKIRKQSIWLRYTKGQRVSIEDKRFAGIQDNDTAPGDIIGGGQEGVAEYIRNNFPGCVCNKMDISRWMRGLHLPMGCTENFPPPPLSGRHKKSIVGSWVEKYLVSGTRSEERRVGKECRS